MDYLNYHNYLGGARDSHTKNFRGVARIPTPETSMMESFTTIVIDFRRLSSVDNLFILEVFGVFAPVFKERLILEISSFN